MAIEQPQIVFHLAAERLPGSAEIQIHQTIGTNILGCDNIIQLWEEARVESCIFSSTGKASRYFTRDTYAASKKISETIEQIVINRAKIVTQAIRSNRGRSPDP